MGVQKVTDSMDKTGIEAAIKSIGQRGASLDKDIQNTGLSILKHVNEHNEVSLFTKLYRSLPKGSRTNALVAWAIAFGKVVVNEDKATKKEFPFICDKGKTTNIPAAMEKPWFDFKKPQDPSEEFSLEAEVAAFQAKLAKWIKAGKVSATDALAVEVLRVKVEVEPSANEERSVEVAVVDAA